MRTAAVEVQVVRVGQDFRWGGRRAMDLMMDAMAIYHRDDTLRLGRALDECGFVWFEDPLPDDDLDGWIELRARIHTPLAGVDAVRFTLKDYARPLARGAFDVLRMDAARMTGARASPRPRGGSHDGSASR